MWVKPVWRPLQLAVSSRVCLIVIDMSKLLACNRVSKFLSLPLIRSIDRLAVPGVCPVVGFECQLAGSCFMHRGGVDRTLSNCPLEIFQRRMSLERGAKLS